MTDKASQAKRESLATASSLLAGLPVDMNLLGESDGSVVVGDLTEGGRVAAGQRNAVVDVEDAGGAARRPDHGGSGNCDPRLVQGLKDVPRRSWRHTLVLLGVNLA